MRLEGRTKNAQSCIFPIKKVTYVFSSIANRVGVNLEIHADVENQVSSVSCAGGFFKQMLFRY